MPIFQLFMRRTERDTVPRRADVRSDLAQPPGKTIATQRAEMSLQVTSIVWLACLPERPGALAYIRAVRLGRPRPNVPATPRQTIP